MYIIQEMQTTNGATALVTPQTFTYRNEAESAYHTALASAAVSQVEVHAVLLYDEHGNTLKREYYEHLSEATA